VDSASIALSVGHTDLLAMAYNVDCNALTLAVADNSYRLADHTDLRLIESVLIHGSAADTLLVVPDVPSVQFLGPPDTEVWIFPESQLDTVVWPGFQSYGIEPGELAGDVVTVRLVSVEGPGAFFGFFSPQDEQTPAQILFDPAHGVNEFEMPASSHLHLNWSFGAPGLYRLTFEIAGKRTDDTSLASAQHSYRLFIGDLADLPATEPTVLSVEGLEPSYPYAPVATMALSVARYGAPSGLPVQWSRQCVDQVTYDLLPWEKLDSTGDDLTTTALGHCQYRVSLIDGAKVVAVSQAVVPYLE